MSVNINRTYSFVDKTVIASEIESELDNIVGTINAANNGVISWDTVKSKGDMYATDNGKGLIVTTPDGAHTYRISVNNSGTIISTLIS